MTLEQFINLLVIILGTIGSIYVLKSYLEQSPTTTWQLAASKWGYNLDVVDALSAQKADGLTGTGLVVLTLVLAVANFIIGPAKFVIAEDRFVAILYASFFGIVVYFVLNKVSAWPILIALLRL